MSLWSLAPELISPCHFPSRRQSVLTGPRYDVTFPVPRGMSIVSVVQGLCNNVFPK